jgi:hypothetical protein
MMTDETKKRKPRSCRKAHEPYRGLISDLAAYIRWAYHNNLTAGKMLRVIVHDIIGVEREGFTRFTPRTHGAAARELNGQAPLTKNGRKT